MANALSRRNFIKLMGGVAVFPVTALPIGLFRIQENPRIPFLYVLQLDKDDAIERITKLATEGPGIEYLVIDPDEAQNMEFDIEPIAETGTKVLMYLNIGNVERDRLQIYPEGPWGDPLSFARIQDPGWPNESFVAYWDSNWQEMIITKALEITQMPGVSGVYLDNVAIHYDFTEADFTGEDVPERFDVAMVEFISRLSEAIKQGAREIDKEDFMVIMQNGEELILETDRTLLESIDGIGTEEVLFADWFYDAGLSEEEIEESRAFRLDILKDAKSEGKVILLIEYEMTDQFSLSETEQREIFKLAAEADFDGVFIAADRDLAGNFPDINLEARSLLSQSQQ